MRNLPQFFGFGRSVLGLDLGRGAVKAVAVTRRPGAPVLLHAAVLDRRTEGFVDDADIMAHLGGWLAENGLANLDVVLGIPQELTTIQISEFPPASGAALESLVAFQTKQLAELFEDAFVYDYHPLAPTPEQQLPVLIGVCLESVVEKRTEELAAAGVSLTDLAVNGTALLSALLALNPECAGEPRPQLLLDVGHASTTLLVVSAGEVRFATSLMFGLESYVAALAQKWGVTPEEAVKSARRPRVSQGSDDDPVSRATAGLIGEINAAREQWAEHERPELHGAEFACIRLAGGGALFPGLAELLGRVYHCETAMIRPPLPVPAETAPLFATAYGLALHGAGAAAAPLSLAPKRLRWSAQRHRRSGVLMAATIALMAFLAFSFLSSFLRLRMREAELKLQRTELTRCEDVIEDLDKVVAELTGLERVQWPLLEHGNRARRFAAALVELSGARGPDDWFVYVGDTLSFQMGKTPAAERAPQTLPEVPAAQPVFSIFTPRAQPEARPTATRPQAGIVLTGLQPLRGIIAAGYTRHLSQEPYQPVRDIVLKLDRSDLFAEVDLLPAGELRGREDVFVTWQEHLNRLQAGGRLSDLKLKPFTLRVPFATTDVRPLQELPAMAGP